MTDRQNGQDEDAAKCQIGLNHIAIALKSKTTNTRSSVCDINNKVSGRVASIFIYMKSVLEEWR